MPGRRVDALAVDLEDRLARDDDVELLVTAGARAQLVMGLDDLVAGLGARVGVDRDAGHPQGSANGSPEGPGDGNPVEIVDTTEPIRRSCLGAVSSSAPMPWRWATAAASVRLRTSSLERIRDTWTLAVFSAMNRRSPISRLVAPETTSSSTCSSRGVRSNGSAAGAGSSAARDSAASRLSRARDASPSISSSNHRDPTSRAIVRASVSESAAAERAVRSSSACALRQSAIARA